MLTVLPKNQDSSHFLHWLPLLVNSPGELVSNRSFLPTVTQSDSPCDAAQPGVSTLTCCPASPPVWGRYAWWAPGCVHASELPADSVCSAAPCCVSPAALPDDGCDARFYPVSPGDVQPDAAAAGSPPESAGAAPYLQRRMIRRGVTGGRRKKGWEGDKRGGGTTGWHQHQLLSIFSEFLLWCRFFLFSLQNWKSEFWTKRHV